MSDDRKPPMDRHERAIEPAIGWAYAMSAAATKLGQISDFIAWSALPWKWIGLGGLAFLLGWALLIIVVGLMGGTR
jgi:hypothetical protein